MIRMKKILVIFLILSLLIILPGSCGSVTISVSPVGNHTVGEIFFINGTTTLPAGKILVIDIEPVRLHPAPSYEPPQNTTALTGHTTIEKSLGGISQWSFVVDSASLKPDNYTIRVTSFEPPIIESSTDFTLESKDRTISGGYPTGSKRNPESPQQQSETSADLPVIVIVVALAFLGVYTKEFRK